MQLAKTATLAATPGSRVDGDRNIYTSAEVVKSVQRALKGRNYYAGEATGNLDQATRDALASFQLDQRQPATGDADEATVQALGVTTAGNGVK
jgi:peptidoglycan hydrolase-like protein with peptidoglycan-binding domain